MSRFCEYSATISRNTNQNKLDVNSQILNRSGKNVTFAASELKYRTPVENEKKIALNQINLFQREAKLNILRVKAVQIAQVIMSLAVV